MRNELIAVGLLVGTMIGIGFLGLPYVFASVGWLTGFVLLMISTAAMCLLTLYVGELVLRTKRYYQLAGLAGHYLGKIGKYFMLAVESFAMYSANIAYLIVIGHSLTQLFSGDPRLWASLIFCVVAIITYLDLRNLGKVELGVLMAKLMLAFAIIGMLLPGVKFARLQVFDVTKVFAPFGVTMFALMCYSVIPEVEEVLAKEKKRMMPVIIASFVIGFIAYSLFTLSFVGALDHVSEIATEALATPLAPLLALTAALTPYISLSLVVRDIYKLDVGLNSKVSWLLSIAPPFLFYLSLSPGFIDILGFSGSIASGLMGLTVGFMVIVARKKGDEKPVYVVPGGILPLIFTMGIFLFGMMFYFLA